MAGWQETHRAVVYPWHCDHIGHMNVRWYAHFFDDAGFHLWSMIGCPQSTLKDHGTGLVVASNKIDFIKELRAGDLIVVRSAITRLGTRSVTSLSRMHHADTGTLHATLESVEVFFDPVARASAPMPDAVREILAAAVVPAGEP